MSAFEELNQNGKSAVISNINSTVTDLWLLPLATVLISVIVRHGKSSRLFSC